MARLTRPGRRRSPRRSSAEPPKTAVITAPDRTRPPVRSDNLRALTAILDLAVAVTKAHFGSVQVVHRDGSLRLVAHRGFTPQAAEFFRVIKDDLSCCHAAFTTRRRVVVRRVSASPLFTGPARRVMLAANLRSCQSTPIVAADGRVIGIISTHFRAPHRPDARQLRRIDLLARTAAIILQQDGDVPVRTPQAIIEEHRSAVTAKQRAVRD